MAWVDSFFLRQGSNELDRSSSPERSSPVMLSAAKHLSADRDRPFAEFTLSVANGLRVTLCDCSNGQGLFFTIEPCLTNDMALPSLPELKVLTLDALKEIT
jgi:hypothetical protein